MARKIVIFDFDGTIADTLSAMLGIYNDLAPRYGCKTISLDEIPMLRSKRPQDIMHRYGVTLWKLPFLGRAVRAKFRERALSVSPHNGIAEALHTLKNNGCTLGILTSNAKANVEAFLYDQGLGDMFAFVISHRNMFGKHRALRTIMRERGFSANDVAYVGDETRDMEAARRAGVMSVGVTWGFQNREAFARVRPDVVVDTPEELVAAVS